MSELILAEAGPATAAAFDTLNEARKRDRLIDTIYNAGTIAVLGTIFYGVCWVYQMSTDINIDLRNAMGTVAAIAFPAVDPYLATPEASAAYAVLLGVDPNSLPQGLGASLEVVKQLLFSPFGWEKLLLGGEVQGSDPYLKWSNFNSAQQFIGADGSFVGHTSDYAVVCDAWSLLYAKGLSKVNPATGQHPVDVVANFVTQDKWYWGGVIAATAIPILSLGLDTLRKVELDHA